MEFLHTSDWHLGRLFHQVSLLEDQAFLLQQLVENLKRQPPAAVIIAGDIYDRSVPPAEAIALLDRFLDQVLGELKIPVLMIPGNHDSAQRLGFASRHLHQAGLHIFTDLRQLAQPVTLEVGDQQVDFFGIPYADPQLVREVFREELEPDQTLDFNQAHTFLVNKIKQNWQPGRKRVLISHCFLDGASESDSERPLSIGGADRVDWQPLQDFDYVALGHLHSPQYKGVEWIRYSGSLMQYSFSEVKQRKGVLRVRLQPATAAEVQFEELCPKRALRVLEGKLDDLLEQGRTDPAKDDYLLVRLQDRQALLNPMARLREVYPQVLHLERKKLTEATTAGVTGQCLQRNELALFADFFQQTRDESLKDEHKALLSEVIEQARQEENA